MRWSILILLHVLGLAVVVFCGWIIQQRPNHYSGYITSLTTAWAVYYSVLQLLYNTNQKVYLAINRVLLKVRKFHTYWQLDFHYDLNRERLRHFVSIMGDLENHFLSERCGKAEVKLTADVLQVYLTDPDVGLRLKIDPTGLHVSTDRRILVPSELYESRTKLLQRITSDIEKIVRPKAVSCTLEVFFKDGIKNPYYGFFVKKIPVGMLQDFRVVFRVDPASECRIRAERDSVGVESTDSNQGFGALLDVLSLKTIGVEEG